MIPPTNHKQLYDEQIRGVFGTFGAGMGIKVCFLQAALESTESVQVGGGFECGTDSRAACEDTLCPGDNLF